MINLYEKLKEIVNGFAGNITARKAFFQLEQTNLNLKVSGLVLCDDKGNRTVIDMANVQHFTLEQWKEIEGWLLKQGWMAVKNTSWLTGESEPSERQKTTPFDYYEFFEFDYQGLGIQMGALYQNRTTGQVLKVVSADCTENRVALAPTELDWTGTVQEMQEQFQLIASYTTLEKE